MKRILVAGIGNAWLKDDGFGGEVVKRLESRELPEGAAVFDFGTGGLDLAYEVMRGYDALLLIDVSRQGGEPGTLYVMEARKDDVEAGIEDGQMINPHAMDPQTVLRFVKTLGAWPGQGRDRRVRAGRGRGDGDGPQRRGPERGRRGGGRGDRDDRRAAHRRRVRAVD